MGLVSKLRGELVDIIEWIDQHAEHARLGASALPERDQERREARGASRTIRHLRGPWTHPPTCFSPEPTSSPRKTFPCSRRSAAGRMDSTARSRRRSISSRPVRSRAEVGNGPIRSFCATPSSGPFAFAPSATYTLRAVKPSLLAELVGTDGSFEAE